MMVRQLDPTKWCSSSLANLVNISPITRVYGRYNELVNGDYKPTYNWGAPHCMNASSLYPKKRPQTSTKLAKRQLSYHQSAINLVKSHFSLIKCC